MQTPSNPVQKLEKIMRVSKRVRQDQMRDALELGEAEFNKKIFDWAEQFHFMIDGDYINFDGADMDSFIAQLDNQFARWGLKRW